MARLCALVLLLAPQAASAVLRLRSNQTVATHWDPPACDELEPGVPCRALYKHPQGSGLVTPYPTESFASAEGCAAQFTGLGDGERCPQITCPKALGVQQKLVCGGSCCPVCWAPDG